jgi:hypothetical protein
MVGANGRSGSASVSTLSWVSMAASGSIVTQASAR